jgi:lipid-binding SYLF domain-containing protein
MTNPSSRYLLTLFLLLAAIPLAQAKQTDDEQRAEVRERAAKTLERLYKEQPGSKQAIESAVGYAVFSNFGMKIFFAGGGSGKGLARDNKSGKETFMKMVEIQAGLGLGAKKYQLVWVFETQNTLDSFVNSGWEIGAQASASAQSGDTGATLEGAISISPGVWLYQMTEHGLALDLTAKGTKYYEDDDLN